MLAFLGGVMILSFRKPQRSRDFDFEIQAEVSNAAAWASFYLRRKQHMITPVQTEVSSAGRPAAGGLKPDFKRKGQRDMRLLLALDDSKFSGATIQTVIARHELKGTEVQALDVVDLAIPIQTYYAAAFLRR
jgi:hypothetical protein